MIKELLAVVGIALVSIFGTTNKTDSIGFNNETNAEYSNLTVMDNENEGIERSNPNFTYFNGTATDAYVGVTMNSYYFYTGQHVYFKFLSQNREFISINYSGPNANFKIFYSNFFLSSDYLTSVQNINTAIDSYYFDMDCEYVLEFTPTVYVNYSSFSFTLQCLNFSMPNYGKYMLHQEFDSSSNVGFHYQVEYYNISTSSSSSTNAFINNYANYGTQYLDLLAPNGNNWFFDPEVYFFQDNRRLVEDTGYDEYSSISYCMNTHFYNSTTYGFNDTRATRGTATFISESALLGCAHIAYPRYDIKENGNTLTLYTGLNKSMTFNPGINTYNGSNYYSKFKATDIFAPLSYIFAFNSNQSKAEHDWSIILSESITTGSRVHSYMGVSSFSYSPLLDHWSHARSAGYPSLTKSDELHNYSKTLWTSYPLENDVTINGDIVASTDIVTSGGNSGGPLYYKTSTFYNGQLVINVYLLGIMSGGNENPANTVHTSYFCRCTNLIVNMAKAIASIA